MLNILLGIGIVILRRLLQPFAAFGGILLHAAPFQIAERIGAKRRARIIAEAEPINALARR